MTSAFGVEHGAVAKAVGEGDLTSRVPSAGKPAPVNTAAIRSNLHRARGSWSGQRSAQQVRTTLRPLKHAAVKAIEGRWK